MNDIIFRVIIPDQKILFKTLMLKGERGADGVSIVSFEKTSTVGLIDTYTITLNDGTTYTFEVKNGTNSAYDSALDDQSENAVQNKVIKSIIDAINGDISGIEGDITDIGTALTGIGQSITDIGTALSNRYTKSEVDNLLSLKADSDDLTANNIDYDNSTSMLSATDAQDAIDEINEKADNAATASGTSYNNADSGLSATDMQAAIDELAQGGGGNANVWEGTQAEYDALPEKDPDTVYFITDAPAAAVKASDIEYQSGVTVEDKLDEIPTAITPSITVTKTSGAWSIRNVTTKQYGKVVVLNFECVGNGTAVNSGNDGFLGSIDNFNPFADTYSISYYGANIFSIRLTKDGILYVRNTNSNAFTLPNGDWLNITLTYLIA